MVAALVAGIWAQENILPPKEKGMIDFALMGGSFFTTKVQVEKDIIQNALHTMFRKVSGKERSFDVENFFDEEELYRRMKQGDVFIAGISQQFFAEFEKELNLVPLVIPILEGKKRQRFQIFTKTGHPTIKCLADLEGGVLAAPMYMNRWFYNLSKTEAMPKDVQLERMPESKSVIMATLYLKTDGGMLPESFFNSFFKMKPHLKKRVTVLGESNSWIQPPVVCRADVVSPEVRERIIELFLDSSNDTEVQSFMDILGISGYSRVTREEIIRSWK